MSKKISLNRGFFAIVDDQDFEAVSKMRWYAVRGATNRTYYARHTQRGPHSTRKCLYLHRVLLGLSDAPRSTQVDHINGDTLDNTRANLRIATAKQNGANRVGMRSASGYKGVYPAGAYKWRARIGKGKGSCLGLYETREEAARAYDAAARERFGEFARVNFPAGDEISCIVSAPSVFDLDAHVARIRETGRIAMRRHRSRLAQEAA